MAAYHQIVGPGNSSFSSRQQQMEHLEKGLMDMSRSAPRPLPKVGEQQRTGDSGVSAQFVIADVPRANGSPLDSAGGRVGSLRSTGEKVGSLRSTGERVGSHRSTGEKAGSVRSIGGSLEKVGSVRSIGDKFRQVELVTEEDQVIPPLPD